MKELINDYIEKKISAISAIRTLSGMFNPDHAVTILSLICSIARVEEGDLELETFKKIWKVDEL